jgi:hypothetical protein
MPLDLNQMALQMRYVVRDRALQGTPVGDIGLLFADVADGIHYEFGAAMRRVGLLEQTVKDQQAQIDALKAPPA